MEKATTSVENSTKHQMDFQVKARSIVFDYARALPQSDQYLALSSVRVVWFCKTLQNWKAMVAILAPGGGFFEVTYNGDKEETYLDVYKKVENVRIPD